MNPYTLFEMVPSSERHLCGESKTMGKNYNRDNFHQNKLENFKLLRKQFYNKSLDYLTKISDHVNTLLILKMMMKKFFFC